MYGNNIYNIKLNSDYLAKWIRYIYIAITASYICVFTVTLIERTGETLLSTIFSIIDSILCLTIVYCFFKLSVVYKAFNKVAIFFSIFTVTGLLLGFIPEAKILQLPPLLMAIVSILPAPLRLYAEYLEHSCFVNILSELDESLAKNWKLVWAINLPASIILMIVAFISSFYINKMETIISLVFPLLLLGSVLALFYLIYKVYVLNKTANFFKNMEI